MRNTKKRGISPVIATVILVAIAIVISIAAAFWMTGLLTSFTAYEKLTLSASISKSTSAGGTTYTVTIVIVNDGTMTAQVQKVLINGVDKSPQTLPTIDPGSSATITISDLSSSEVGLPGRIVKITIVTLRASYETQLTVP
jgi:flagellin-like protein